jgi:hypothetical protein
VDTPLHASLDRHLDALISGPEGDIEAVLEQCLRESSLSWSGASDVRPFLYVLRDLRSKHPQGMSGRPRRRKAVVDKLIAEVHRIWETQERDWWKGIATHPIATVVERLSNIPEEYLDAALECFLQLPVSDSHIHNERIHDFLRAAHSRLIRLGRVKEPMVVAHIGYLVAKREYAGTRELLERFPLRDQSALGGVVAYLRYVIDKRVHLSGHTSFSTLSPEDLFLSACYYEGTASPALMKQAQWDYRSLKNTLFDKGGEHDLNDFKVRGLQPRIAELAFRRVYGLMHGANTQDKLRDLNLERMERLTPPWSLDRKPYLP